MNEKRYIENLSHTQYKNTGIMEITICIIALSIAIKQEDLNKLRNSLGNVVLVDEGSDSVQKFIPLSNDAIMWFIPTQFNSRSVSSVLGTCLRNLRDFPDYHTFLSDNWEAKL